MLIFFKKKNFEKKIFFFKVKEKKIINIIKIIMIPPTLLGIHRSVA